MAGHHGEPYEGEPVPALTREEISRWHQLMGDTIEAMHDGVQPQDAQGLALGRRFLQLGGPFFVYLILRKGRGGLNG